MSCQIFTRNPIKNLSLLIDLIMSIIAILNVHKRYADILLR